LAVRTRNGMTSWMCTSYLKDFARNSRVSSTILLEMFLILILMFDNSAVFNEACENHF